MGQSPTVGAIHLAIVQGAVYDAVNMIDRGYEPYIEGLPKARASASKSAAAAIAAHRVLVGLQMTPPLNESIVKRLDALLVSSIAASIKKDGARSVAAGIAAGEAAAAAMLAERANDGRYGTFKFTSGTEVGQWRPEEPAYGSDPFAWVAQVKPFVITDPAMYRTPGPRSLTSAAYTREFNEVKRLGSPTGVSQRNAAQEAVAQFYTVNPTELLPRTFRTIATQQGLTITEQARLFAMQAMANADALIATWDDKTHWSFWRPITAIRNAESDGNPNTIPDPTWAPMVATPPYPDQPSGYNAVTGSYMTIAEEFFGTKRMDFQVVRVAPGTPNVTREYTRFWDVVKDTIDARVYQGIHFRTPDVHGAHLGREVARWVAANAFQPVD
jgi:hypothetical protein